MINLFSSKDFYIFVWTCFCLWTEYCVNYVFRNVWIIIFLLLQLDKIWKDLKFRINLAVTNSKKSIVLYIKNFFFPEFHSWKIGVIITHD